MNAITIRPLCEESLTEATHVRDNLFKGLSKYEKLTLHASLYPIENTHVYENLVIQTLCYWCAIIENKVVGLVGLYEEKSKLEDTLWLGWYGVDESFRGHGIGQKLIDFAIFESKRLGKKHLLLYTTEHDEYRVARILYERLGFTCKKKRGKTLYYDLDLMQS